MWIKKLKYGACFGYYKGCEVVLYFQQTEGYSFLHRGNTEKTYGMGVMGSYYVWGGGVRDEENAKWESHERDVCIRVRLQS